MRMRIHRGTQEIGGTCIEIEALGKRIALDVGLPLDAPDEGHERLLSDVAGFRERDDSLLGVLSSHPHQDHYGLARCLRGDVAVHSGEAAHRILKAASPYVPNGHAFADPRFLRHRTPVDIGPFRVTPLLVDHSAFDAYALVVEAEGKRVFYSGDFRAHGRAGRVRAGAGPGAYAGGPRRRPRAWAPRGAAEAVGRGSTPARGRTLPVVRAHREGDLRAHGHLALDALRLRGGTVREHDAGIEGVLRTNKAESGQVPGDLHIQRSLLAGLPPAARNTRSTPSAADTSTLASGALRRHLVWARTPPCTAPDGSRAHSYPYDARTFRSSVRPCGRNPPPSTTTTSRLSATGPIRLSRNSLTRQLSLAARS